MIQNQFAYTQYKRIDDSQENLLKAHSRNSLNRFEARSVNSVFVNKSSQRSSFFLSKPKSQLTVNVQYFTYEFLQKGQFQQIESGCVIIKFKHGRVLLDEKEFLSLSKSQTLKGLLITHTIFAHQSENWIVFITKQHQIYTMEYQNLPVVILLKKLIFGHDFNQFWAQQQILLLVNKSKQIIEELFAINFKTGRVFTFNLAPCQFLSVCLSDFTVYLLDKSGIIFFSVLYQMEGRFRALELGCKVLQLKSIRNRQKSKVLLIISNRQYALLNSNRIQRVLQRQPFLWKKGQSGVGLHFKDATDRCIVPTLTTTQLIWIIKS